MSKLHRSADRLTRSVFRGHSLGTYIAGFAEAKTANQFHSVTLRRGSLTSEWTPPSGFGTASSAAIRGYTDLDLPAASPRIPCAEYRFYELGKEIKNRAMSRYKGRTSRKTIAWDFPHLVEIAVPPGRFSKRLDAMHAFHTERGISACLGRGRHGGPISASSWWRTTRWQDQ